MKINGDLIVDGTDKQLKEIGKIDRNERCTMEYNYGQHNINHSTWGSTIITNNLSAQSVINNQGDVSTDNGKIVVSSNKYHYVKIQAYLTVGGVNFEQFKGDVGVDILKNGTSVGGAYATSNQNYWYALTTLTYTREIQQGDYFNLSMTGAYNGSCTVLNAKIYMEFFNN